MTFKDIIGLKIVAVKGIPEKYQTKRQSKTVPTQYVLFDDGKTYLCFEEQDYYTYHDCSSSAMQLHIYQDEQRYAQFMTYPNSTNCDFMW